MSVDAICPECSIGECEVHNPQCRWICPEYGCGLRCGGVRDHIKNDPEHPYHQCPVHFGRRCPKCDHEAVFLRGHFLCMRCGWKHP